MSSLRDRLNALRPGAAARQVSRESPRVPAPGTPDLRETVTTMPDWDLPAAELRAAMITLATLSRNDAIASLAPEDLLFLDLETTGLSLGAGTLAFLVGLARLRRGPAGMELIVEQRLMRALSHEPEILRAAGERLEACGAVVTYNGKSYDVPLLLGRCVLARVAAPPARPHFDALHPARRLLAHVLPDVRLVSLEWALWRSRREDDLGGAAIPAAFFASLRGDDGLMEDVLRHNADDLVTLARLPPLLARLAGGGSAPTGVAADPLVLADLRLKAGERGAALAAIDGCSTIAGSPRSIRRARLAKRAGGAVAARDHWQRLRRELRAGPEPHEELAKILEHHDRDCAGALEVVEQALRLFGSDPEPAARLGHRRARLLRKLGRGSSCPEEGLSG